MSITSSHFGTEELRCHGEGCGQPGCPLNLCTQKLVDVLEEFRAKVGKPVIVDSAYRCAFHNENIAVAAQHSQHVLGNAADIRVDGMSAAQLEEIALTIQEINGLGRDDFENYIHIDVRDSPRATWCYNAAGSVIPYYVAGEPDRLSV
jgi:hypothetical protein